jgi:hypothetical protein
LPSKIRLVEPFISKKDGIFYGRFSIYIYSLKQKVEQEMTGETDFGYTSLQNCIVV